ncbi:MAG: ABC transporter permease [Bacteroidales bacterium]|nr:ABC transporter permease [Bacteroidales bacterium]
MSNSGFIVKRLILSRRNKGIVHIISLISLIGVAVGAFALVVVLSVFNGFTDVAKTMLEKTSPPLLIERSGGYITQQTIDNLKAKTNNSSVLNDGYSLIPVIKTTAMVTFSDNRSIVTLFGIDSSFFLYNPLDTCIVSGKNIFNVKDSLFCLMGINQASFIGLNRGAEKMNIPVKLTVPNATNEDAMVMEDKLSTVSVYYQACYQTHSDLDEGNVFISIDKMRQLLDIAPDVCSQVYVAVKNPSDIPKIQTFLQDNLPNDYSVKTVLQQEPLYFRIVSSEKLAVYIILSFIIFIAAINIVSTIIILHIQKEKMNKILRTMGMQQKDLRRIYFYYGLTLNIAGCLLGIALGLALCLLQQRFGLVKLAEDAFVVDAFPVQIMIKDVLAVIILVVVIGSLAISAVTSRIKEKI